MADIKTQISKDVKEAMRQKDKERLAALRLILASFKQKLFFHPLKIDENT